MPSPKINRLWFRAWMVASIAWAILVCWVNYPISSTPPSFETVESQLSPSIVDLRKRCTPYTQSVEIRMTDGSLTVCFRSAVERDTYFKWFGRESEHLMQESSRKRIVQTAVKALAGFVFFALGLLAAEWVLRGAGKSFLFQSSTTEALPLASQPLHTFNTDKLRAAAPLAAVVSAIWLSLPLIGDWGLIKKGLDAFGPESSGSFVISGLIVLLYRKTIHPLVTVGALLIFIPPAALLFYSPLKASGLDFLLIPFGIACVELTRYAGSRLPSPTVRFARFGWQLLLFVASFVTALLLFSFVIYS